MGAFNPQSSGVGRYNFLHIPIDYQQIDPSVLQRNAGHGDVSELAVWSSVASKTSQADGEINPRDTGLSRDVMLLSIFVPHLRALTSRLGSEEWLRLTRPIAGLLGSAEEGLSSGGEGCCTQQSMDSTRRRLRLCQPSAHPAWKNASAPKKLREVCKEPRKPSPWHSQLRECGTGDPLRQANTPGSAASGLLQLLLSASAIAHSAIRSEVTHY